MLNESLSRVGARRERDASVFSLGSSHPSLLLVISGCVSKIPTAPSLLLSPSSTTARPPSPSSSLPTQSFPAPHLSSLFSAKPNCPPPPSQPHPKPPPRCSPQPSLQASSPSPPSPPRRPDDSVATLSSPRPATTSSRPETKVEPTSSSLTASPPVGAACAADPISGIFFCGYTGAA